MRPNKMEHFFKLVEVIGSMSTCDRGKPGAVIVRDNRILATGYAGSPAGIKHCDEIGHEMIKIIYEDNTISTHCNRTVHAEINAIINAAKHGVCINESEMYCSMFPCYFMCAKAIVNAGIKKVFARNDYHASKYSKELFDAANIEWFIMDTSLTY